MNSKKIELLRHLDHIPWINSQNRMPQLQPDYIRESKLIIKEN